MSETSIDIPTNGSGPAVKDETPALKIDFSPEANKPPTEQLDDHIKKVMDEFNNLSPQKSVEPSKNGNQ